MGDLLRSAGRRDSALNDLATIAGSGPSTSHVLTKLRDEVTLGLRALLHDRGFALAAVLSIGLGVGANSALFSLVDQALLRMLLVRDPGRLVLLDWKGTFIGKGWARAT